MAYISYEVTAKTYKRCGWFCCTLATILIILLVFDAFQLPEDMGVIIGLPIVLLFCGCALIGALNHEWKKSEERIP
jgi:hypothetical protein